VAGFILPSWRQTLLGLASALESASLGKLDKGAAKSAKREGKNGERPIAGKDVEPEDWHAQDATKKGMDGAASPCKVRRGCSRQEWANRSG
jgi:hypothetical protein